MTKPEDREKVLQKQISQLKRDVTNLKEQTKILQRKIEFTQDEMAKLAVFAQALIQSVTFIVQVARQLAEKENIQHQMGLPPVDPNTPPTPPPQPGTAGLH